MSILLRTAPLRPAQAFLSVRQQARYVHFENTVDQCVSIFALHLRGFHTPGRSAGKAAPSELIPLAPCLPR